MSIKKSTATKIISLVIILIAVIFAFFIYGKHHKNKTSIVNTNGGNPSGKATTGNLNQPSDTSNPSTNPNNASPSTSTTTVSKPSGTFVSNHNPSSSNETEQSICIVAPGVSCVITFSMNGTTKSLSPTQSAGPSGSVSWLWTPQSLGLTSGSWDITAIATQNGATAMTKDSQTLNVK